MGELKKCPFCGQDESVVRYNESDERTLAWVDCDNPDCGAVGPTIEGVDLDDASREAREAWNTRPAPAQAAGERSAFDTLPDDYETGDY